jgi:hypothetical protein
MSRSISTVHQFRGHPGIFLAPNAVQSVSQSPSATLRVASPPTFPILSTGARRWTTSCVSGFAVDDQCGGSRPGRSDQSPCSGARRGDQPRPTTLGLDPAWSPQHAKAAFGGMSGFRLVPDSGTVSKRGRWRRAAAAPAEDSASVGRTSDVTNGRGTSRPGSGGWPVGSGEASGPSRGRCPSPAGGLNEPCTPRP